MTSRVLLSALLLGTVAHASPPASEDGTLPFVTVGLFMGQIEEAARIFTPVRMLPVSHAESGGHSFPTVQRFHRSEAQLLENLRSG